jgi:hypothetical protein
MVYPILDLKCGFLSVYFFTSDALEKDGFFDGAENSCGGYDDSCSGAHHGRAPGRIPKAAEDGHGTFSASDAQEGV